LTSITREVFTKPGLFPVVHLIEVVVDSETTHGIPSIITVLSAGVGEKFLPVNVTTVPPRTLPNLGSIAVRRGVDYPS